MRTYSVTPNVDASGWFVKLENVAPEDVYSTKDDAIAAATQMARENTPSKVEILDKEHNVIEEERY